MSDYLGNLVARTISPSTAVRPQLPSLFEPAPASGKGRAELEFEQENFVNNPRSHGLPKSSRQSTLQFQRRVNPCCANPNKRP